MQLLQMPNLIHIDFDIVHLLLNFLISNLMHLVHLDNLHMEFLLMLLIYFYILLMLKFKNILLNNYASVQSVKLFTVAVILYVVDNDVSNDVLLL